MYALIRLALLIAVPIGGAVATQAQPTISEQGGAKGATSSISGRVTIGGKGAPGVLVVARSNQFTGRRAEIFKSRTDADGHFRLSAAMAGQYLVAPIAPLFINPDQDLTGQSWKPVTLVAGEAVEDIDFALVRGGVITGRVTDADGRPVVAKYVRLTLVDKSGQRRPSPEFESPLLETDDRGIYRVYGLSPGRYLVSMGLGDDSFDRDNRNGNIYYARTFHPNVTDESKAEIVEVAEGGEATGVDITLGRPLPVYRATGRIVDAATGKPVPDIIYGCGAILTNVEGFATVTYGNRSNSRGEFRIEGLTPGRYGVLVEHRNASEWYSEAVRFEVTDKDVGGLEIKLHRGATLSGVAVLEGTDDPTVLAGLSQMQLVGTVNARAELGESRYSISEIGADGSFNFKGLRPGNLEIYLAGKMRKGFTLLRVERDGVEQQRERFKVAAGEHVTGVRVVLGYGTGVVRGQVEAPGGKLPDNVRFYIQAEPAHGGGRNVYSAESDARGRFIIENMVAGEYELTISPSYYGEVAAPARPLVMPAKQTVTVTNTAETEATFVLDLNAPAPAPQ
jgi:hypothetical protein